MCSTSSLAEPRLLIVHEIYLQYKHGSARLLDFYYSEDNESELVEEPENEETIQRQPAFITPTGLL